MDNDNQSFADGEHNNNGRKIDHLIYRTWSRLPEPEPDAPFIDVVKTFCGTTYQVSTVRDIAGMIHMFVSPPLGQNPWTCAKHCHRIDITAIELRQHDADVWAYLTFSDNTRMRCLINPIRNVSEDLHND
jgi:hypothetical protein